jgi:hypothetical protein
MSELVFDLPVRAMKRSSFDIQQENVVKVYNRAQSIMKPKRHTWDHLQIDKLARSSEIYEKKFGEILQTKLGANFKVTPHDNKYNRFDFMITKESSSVISSSENEHGAPRYTILGILKEHETSQSSKYPKTIRLELECGVMQGQWVSNINENRSKWVQGLNVVSRKISEGQHFSIFIKHNMACNSFFAATYDFIKSHSTVKIQKTNAIKFKTDNVVYSMPWSVIDNSFETKDFCYDDFEALKTLIEYHLK